MGQTNRPGKPKDSSLLCSDHFPEDSFVVHYNNRKRLKPGIVPTILMKKAKFKKQGNALLEKNYRSKKLFICS